MRTRYTQTLVGIDDLPRLIANDGGMTQHLRASPTPRILIIDGEPRIRQLLTAAFMREGWSTISVGSGQEGLAQARRWEPHAIVLDDRLPDFEGLEVLHTLRRCAPRLPILMVSAYGEVEQRIKGITAGADDFVAKPFSVAELTVRVMSLLRRTLPVPGSSEAPLRVGDLELSEQRRQVTRAGEHITLTATEFSLLRFFMTHAEMVLTKRQLLRHVWHNDLDLESNVVELYISYLRRKIDHGREPMLRTLRGIGYVIRPASHVCDVASTRTDASLAS